MNESPSPLISRSPAARGLDAATLLLSLALGGWFWLHFFAYGRLALTFEDWPMHNFYLDIFRQSLAHGQLPWNVNWWPQGTDKLLAVPETPLSPVMFLLPWISNGTFVAWDVCLFYAAGVWGWWVLKGTFRWSRLTFLLAVALSSFNGYIVSRMAVGHLIWTGYFLSPWVFYGIHAVLTAPRERRFSWVPLAFALAALFFSGAFHLAVWWFFFIAFVALCRPSRWAPLACALAGSGLMAAFRLLPAAFFLHEKSGFLTGYRSLEMVRRAFVSIEPYVATTPGPWRPENLGWWEFDHYIGWAALLFVALFAALEFASGRKENRFLWPLAGASVALAALSWGNVYAFIHALPHAVFRSERISTRLICLTFLGFLVIALAGLERRQSGKGRWAFKAVAAVVLVLALHGAWVHAQVWLLPKLESSHPYSWYFPHLENLTPAYTVAPHQARYHVTVIGAFALSVFSVAALGLVWASPRVRRAFGGEGEAAARAESREEPNRA